MTARRKTTEAERQPLPPVKTMVHTESLPGAPQRTCGNCEHFDGGGIDKDGRPINREGRCHNGISGKFRTSVAQGCGHGFYPCCVRWPLRAGPGGIYGNAK